MDRNNATHGPRFISTDLFGNRLPFVPTPRKKKKKTKKTKPTKKSKKKKTKHNNPTASNHATYGNELAAALPRTARLTQANLYGVAILASDSEHFGHTFPSTPGTNTTIITFQNIGQQPNDATKSK